ncbi:MAG TPA: class I SAM-dependent methyltransferase [Noviherbaspirillum sp.]|uniref:class I SAM-dependent methyltransferase n=1 Tax=Noviherbaspirillum sp. TaxID=1926288 RepID=UPI002F95054C
MSTTRLPFQSSSFAKLAEVESGHWWFQGRNQLLLWALARKAKRFQSFLEVGCGTGYVLEAVSTAYPSSELHGAEYFEEGLEYARARVPKARFRTLDATTMDDAERYDVVGAFDVIEHIEEDELVLRNLARALKAEGTLMVTVPQHQWLWSKSDEYACHVRRYSRADLIKKTERAGLRVTYVTSFVSLLLPLMCLSRVSAQEGERDPMAEFRIPGWMNAILKAVMRVELAMLKLGIRFPAGGSLLLVATKPKDSWVSKQA